MTVSMNDFLHTCHSLLGVGGGRPAWAGVVFKGSASTFETGIPLKCLRSTWQDSLKAACSILYVSAQFSPDGNRNQCTQAAALSPPSWNATHTAGRRSPKGLHTANAGRYRPPVLHIHLYRFATCPTLLPFRYVLLFPVKKISPGIKWSAHVRVKENVTLRVLKKVQDPHFTG